ncbi:MAG: 16S rRNA (cytidine(1402)-2'-O)-methyltransferase [Candidatus Eremiobacteraeota bacterium]|nr:16S rRNA (cytidine(1402)-2'-O)-methyltransferase [Candidatus Eremiobacteraeota bacterium]
MPLIFVPTPLGNLRDITLRSLDALRDCSLVVAEDSRVARKLLGLLDIHGKDIWSYHEHNAAGATAMILERARSESIAVVTDAGTPGISDPGTALVAAARETGISVEVLPGPSAAIGVAVLSGFDLRRFVFEGFAPRASVARRRAFTDARSFGVTSIWYESPKRILAALADLAAVAADARVFLLREYTKLHEQQLFGNATEVAAALATPVRGEIAFAIAFLPASPLQAPSAEQLHGAVDELLGEGRSVAEIAKSLAEKGYGSRRDLYATAAERKQRRKVAGGGRERA